MNYTAQKWGDQNAYLIPDDGKYRTINFSGGRSSAYMLHNIWQAHDGVLPESVKVVFCNTGKEREETLEFVRRCGEAFNLEIVWLEYRYRTEAAGGKADPKRVHKVVTFETASRNGEPFVQLNRQRKMLPNQSVRTCTTELKVLTTERYVTREVGWPKKQTRRVLGYRYDEPRRWEKSIVEKCDIEFPMVHARVSKQDVQRFWSNAPFDLGIHSARGNCDLCFLKGRRDLTATIRENPSLAVWWIDQESSIRQHRRNQDCARFSKRFSYVELAEAATTQIDLGLIDDTPEATDCFCTD